jgi:hypothetical protein
MQIVQEIQHVFSSQEITFAKIVLLAHYELICKFITLRKRTRSATMCNSRISKIFPGRARISVGKWLSNMEKYSGSLYLRGHILQARARFLFKFVRLRRRHHKLSMDTKIIKDRHCKLHQLYVGKSTKVCKLCRKLNTFFPSPSHGLSS